MTSKWVRGFWGGCLVFLSGWALAAADKEVLPVDDPAALIESLKDGQLMSSAAHAVAKLKIESGPAGIVLDQGVIFPAKPVGGKVRELVFVGQGRFQFRAPDEVERKQLEQFAGSARLDEPFDSVVLVIGNDGIVDQLLESPAPANGLAQAAFRAGEVFQAWRGSTERKETNIDAGILRTLYDASGNESFLSAWVEGKVLGRFLFQYLPTEQEQIVLSQFVKKEYFDNEWTEIRRAIRKQQKKGRFRDFSADDVGDWDTWVSTSEKTALGTPKQGNPGFEVRHNDLDISLAGGHFEMSGRDRMSIDATLGGRRIVPLTLSGALGVDKIRIAGYEKNLAFLRQGRDLAIVLPEAPAAGTKIELTVEYHGDVFEKITGRTWVLTDTTNWYPRIEREGRSTFQVTYHYPDGYMLASGGQQVDGGKDPDGRVWEKRIISIPVLFLTFEVGDFKWLKGKAGHIDVTVGIDPLVNLGKDDANGLTPDVLLETAVDALEYYEQVFGPYPLDYMTLVTSPRHFSQGSLGMVSISSHYFLQEKLINEFLHSGDPRTVVAHELAHQWWGNAVGWQSYRDQWISEAMATWASNLYATNRMKPNKGKSLAAMTTGWKKDLGTKTDCGLPIDALGPVVLGTRLASSIDESGDSYHAIVYKKGAIVLNTLAETFKNTDDFTGVLGKVFKRWSGQTISTEEFLKSCSESANVDFAPVYNSLVYGTGVPEVYYSYSIERASEGGWLLKGTAERFPAYPPRYRFSLRQVPEGGIDVVRTGMVPGGDEKSIMVVPIQIEVEVDNAPKQGGGFVSGKLMLTGSRTPFEFKLAQKPKALLMDPGSRVLAFFYSDQITPRRVLFFRGRWALDAGDLDGALDLFQKALAAPVSTGVAETHINRAAESFDEDLTEKLINQQIARVYLDQDQIEKAEKAANSANTSRHDLARHLRQEQYILDARLALRRGDYGKAFSLLEDSLDRRTKEPIQKVNDSEHPFVEIPKPRTAEAFVILAVAAKKFGRTAEFGKAAQVAQRRGAVLDLLK